MTEYSLMKGRNAVADPTSNTLGEHLLPLLEALVDLHELGSRRKHIFALWNLLTKESLALPAGIYTRTHSTINGDGMPVQVCVSLGKKQGGLRLLTEAGPLDRSIAERIEASTHVLAIAGHLLGIEASASAVNQAMLELFPAYEDDLSSWGGGLWFALGFTPKGDALKIYINMKWGQMRDRWVRAGRAMSVVGLSKDALERWCFLARRWGNLLNPAGFMMDPRRGGLKKIKVYFRTGAIDARTLVDLLHDLDYEFDPEIFFSTAQTIAPGVLTWPNQALVISHEIDMASPMRPGVKIDIACGFAPASDTVLANRIEKASLTLGLDPTEYRETYGLIAKDTPTPLLDRMEHHQFIGLGHTPGEQMRLNVYLKPMRPKILVKKNLIPEW